MSITIEAEWVFNLPCYMVRKASVQIKFIYIISLVIYLKMKEKLGVNENYE